MIERRELYKKLIEAGVHFGHQASRKNPKMDRYIWGIKNRINLIDVSQTANQLEDAARFLRSVAMTGKQILFVGTKKSAHEVIAELANNLSMPYFDARWVGGTLSNYAQVKKSVTRLLHDEDIIAKADKYPLYTKKELNVIKKRAERARKIVGGITTLKWPVGALVLVDVSKEESALKEAARMGIPVVGLVDTNSDPSRVDYVIPANDDSEKSIRCILEYLGNAIQAGISDARAEASQKEALKKEEAAKKVAVTLQTEDVENPVTALPEVLALDTEGLEEDQEKTGRKRGKALARKPQFGDKKEQ